MSITDDCLLIERPHPLGRGVQRIYRFHDGNGLSVVNAEVLHSYPFAWEIAVIKGVADDGRFTDLDYSTPLTDDVEVCMSDNEANAFIAKAKDHFNVQKVAQ